MLLLVVERKPISLSWKGLFVEGLFGRDDTSACTGFVHRAACVSLETCTSCFKIEVEGNRVLPWVQVNSARTPQGRLTGYPFLLKSEMFLQSVRLQRYFFKHSFCYFVVNYFSYNTYIINIYWSFLRCKIILPNLKKCFLHFDFNSLSL